MCDVRKNSQVDTIVVFSHTGRESELPRGIRSDLQQFRIGTFGSDPLRKSAGVSRIKRERLHKAFTGVKNILCGKTRRGKEKKFPQAGNVQSTLTEKIHSLRIAASEGPICSMVQGHDGVNQITSTKKGISVNFCGKLRLPRCYRHPWSACCYRFASQGR